MESPYSAPDPGIILRITLPFPKSLRQNGKVPDSYHKLILSRTGGRTLAKTEQLCATMYFYGKWKDSKDNLRRRDHLNYAAVLIDALCAALGIDDCQIVHWKDLIKIHKPDPPEYVVVTLSRSKIR